MAIDKEKEAQMAQEHAAAQPAPEKLSMRQQLRNKFKADNPDDDYENDADGELLGGRIMSRLDEQDKQIGKYKNSDEKLRKMFMDNPATARFFTRWAAGEDPLNVYAAIFGDKLKDIVNGPDAAKNMEKGLNEYFNNLKSIEEADKIFAENTDKTMQLLKKKIEAGEDVAKLDAAWDAAMKIAAEAATGIVTEETLNMIMKSQSYDTDVTNARNDGMAAARNERYTEQLRQRAKGDGQPAAGQGIANRANPDREVSRPNPSRKSAWEAEEQRSVW